MTNTLALSSMLLMKKLEYLSLGSFFRIDIVSASKAGAQEPCILLLQGQALKNIFSRRKIMLRTNTLAFCISFIAEEAKKLEYLSLEIRSSLVFVNKAQFQQSMEPFKYYSRLKWLTSDNQSSLFCLFTSYVDEKRQGVYLTILFYSQSYDQIENSCQCQKKVYNIDLRGQCYKFFSV